MATLKPSFAPSMKVSKMFIFFLTPSRIKIIIMENMIRLPATLETRSRLSGLSVLKYHIMPQIASVADPK